VKAVEKILLNWVCESALHLQTIVSVCVCVTEIQINTLAHTLTFSHIHRHALSHTLNTHTYSHTNTLTYYSQTSTFPIHTCIRTHSSDLETHFIPLGRGHELYQIAKTSENVYSLYLFCFV